MRLAVLALALISACGGPSSFRPPALPELVTVIRPSLLLAATELRLIPGERMIWDVQAKGFSIARAELIVSDATATSRVETGVLASAVTSLRDELVTSLDREHARPRSSYETLVVEGKRTQVAVGFGADGYTLAGTSYLIPRAQTIHTALGLLRAWVSADAHAGVLPILVAGHMYQLEVAQPTMTTLAGKSMYRVDCRVGALGSVALWFATTEDRAPARIEVSTEDGKVTAEMIERTETK
jgi:hypothetical protein